MAKDDKLKTKVELDVSIDKKTEKSLNAQLRKIFNIKEGDSKSTGIAKIGATIGKTFTKSGSDMNKIFGMVTKGASKANIALAATVAAVKAFADQFARIAEDSKKFISNNSLFTDKATLDMMQRTGQSTTGAQSTNRALEQLGLSFEDLQSGKFTEEQGKAFEEIRQRELTKLEEIQSVAGPMMDGMQRAMLSINLMMTDIRDFITLIFARSSSINNLVNNIQPFIAKVSSFATGLIRDIAPVMDLIADIIDLVMSVLEPLMSTVGGVVSLVMTILTPILKYIGNLIRATVPILRALTPILDIIITLLELMIQLNPILNLIIWVVEFIEIVVTKVAEGINWLTNKLTEFASGFIDFINGIILEMRKFDIAGWKPFEHMKTIENVAGIKSGTQLPPSFSSSNTINNNQQSTTYNYNDNDLLSNEYILINW